MGVGFAASWIFHLKKQTKDNVITSKNLQCAMSIRKIFKRYYLKVIRNVIFNS